MISNYFSQIWKPSHNVFFGKSKKLTNFKTNKYLLGNQENLELFNLANCLIKIEKNMNFGQKMSSNYFSQIWKASHNVFFGKTKKLSNFKTNKYLLGNQENLELFNLPKKGKNIEWIIWRMSKFSKKTVQCKIKKISKFFEKFSKKLIKFILNFNLHYNTNLSSWCMLCWINLESGDNTKPPVPIEPFMLVLGASVAIVGYFGFKMCRYVINHLKKNNQFAPNTNSNSGSGSGQTPPSEPVDAISNALSSVADNLASLPNDATESVAEFSQLLPSCSAVAAETLTANATLPTLISENITAPLIQLVAPQINSPLLLTWRPEPTISSTLSEVMPTYSPISSTLLENISSPVIVQNTPQLLLTWNPSEAEATSVSATIAHSTNVNEVLPAAQRTISNVIDIFAVDTPLSRATEEAIRFHSRVQPSLSDLYFALNTEMTELIHEICTTGNGVIVWINTRDILYPVPKWVQEEKLVEALRLAEETSKRCQEPIMDIEVAAAAAKAAENAQLAADDVLTVTNAVVDSYVSIASYLVPTVILLAPVISGLLESRVVEATIVDNLPINEAITLEYLNREWTEVWSGRIIDFIVQSSSFVEPNNHNLYEMLFGAEFEIELIEDYFWIQGLELDDVLNLLRESVKRVQDWLDRNNSESYRRYLAKLELLIKNLAHIGTITSKGREGNLKTSKIKKNIKRYAKERNLWPKKQS